MQNLLRLAILLLPAVANAAPEAAKTSSALYPAEVVARVQANVEAGAWGAPLREQAIAAARPWMEMPEEELWSLMFDPGLERSWMVWSDGHSPVTGEPVPMYNWKVDALAHPWKVQDPTSGQWFPTNDFEAFYRSGLNAAGVFERERADTSLLFNEGHPDPDDPLHRFGVDDGFGYVNEAGERWRFIGAYLVYGQFKQVVLGGIQALSAAHVLIGEAAYARRAAILLDRVADFYPDFDYQAQGILYEGPGSTGYVSVWHDSCEETRELAMAYDMIFEAAREDAELMAFLSRKAAEAGLENAKASFGDIQRNIEDRILRDALVSPEKIHSNYPRNDTLRAMLVAVLQRPRSEFWEIVDPMIARATAVDGVTGEKGLSGYTAFTVSALASFLGEMAKADGAFLPDVLARHPQLHSTYRFHIDTWCLERYYPGEGDAGYFAGPVERYVAMNFSKPMERAASTYSGWGMLAPSMYALLWELYAATGDAAFVQTLYRENGLTLDGLPHDIFGTEPAAFQAAVQAVIAREGTRIDLGSVNKEAWRLAILRSGEGPHARALWLNYESGGGHGHQDGMNLGLFAHGLDLMPDFGYPPVQFGGWGAPRALWYKMTAAHNTVVVDGANQPDVQGETTLWADGHYLRGLRASAPEMAPGGRYERTALLVDVTPEIFYVVDVFRVTGGADHTKFLTGHFGTLELPGLSLEAAEDYGHNTQMRAMRLAPAPDRGWLARWDFEDSYGLLDPAETPPLGMHCWGFTPDAHVGTVEAWIVKGIYNESAEAWIPRLVVRRQAAEAPLESTFVAVIEPFADAPKISAIESLPLHGAQGPLGEGDVALAVTLPEGGRDLLILRDPDSGAGAESTLEAHGLRTDAELALVRLDADGAVRYAALAKGSYLHAAGFTLGDGSPSLFLEVLP